MEEKNRLYLELFPGFLEKLRYVEGDITSSGILSILDRPDIGWVKIAAGMGVPAASVRTAEGLAKEFGKALSEPGPHLIEMEIVPK